MQNVNFGQICELSYRQDSGLALPRLVSDLAGVLHRLGTNDYHLGWDCDDIAVFDIPHHRIILASADQPCATVSHRLLIGVGPSPRSSDQTKGPIGHAALCRRIVHRLEISRPSDHRQTRSFPGILTPEHVDDILYAPGSNLLANAAWRQPNPTGSAEFRAQNDKVRHSVDPPTTLHGSDYLAASLLINGLTWSLASVAPMLALTVFGSGLIGALLRSGASQLPR